VDVSWLSPRAETIMSNTLIFRWGSRLRGTSHRLIAETTSEPQVRTQYR
jgi:hypothetical protein